MQISPKVYRDKLRKMEITPPEAFHIDNNILLGCMILRESLDQGNSIETAIAELVGSDRRLNDILVGFTNTMIAEKRPARHKSVRGNEPTSQEAVNSVAPPLVK